MPGAREQNMFMAADLINRAIDVIGEEGVNFDAAGAADLGLRVAGNRINGWNIAPEARRDVHLHNIHNIEEFLDFDIDNQRNNVVPRGGIVRKVKLKVDAEGVGVEKEHQIYKWLNGGHLTGDLGVEVEVEGQNLPVVVPGWISKRDGSLRGESLEYVFKEPAELKQAAAHLTALQKALKDSKLDFSFRTSVHVHINVMQLTRKELNSFLYLAHILEDALVRYSGASREGNRFCLRSRDSSYQVEMLKEFISYYSLRFFDDNAAKYAAINMSCLGRFGSIEFRSMRGTVDDAVLLPWFEVLVNLREYARKYTTKQLAEQVRGNALDVAKNVFQKHFDAFNFSGLEQSMKEAYELFIEIPYVKQSKRG